VQIPGLRLDAPLDELAWRSTHQDGVEWIDLAGVESEGARQAAMTVLIRMAPGCGYPHHRHIGSEDVLVLAGGYVDGDGQHYTAGSFVRYPAGSEHQPVAIGDRGEPISGDNPACILFAVAHAGTDIVRTEPGAPPRPATG
jgi:anti-sigma factor ChrR (cupin superfamily)